MTAAVIVPVIDEGLGNSAYLADLGDGRALAVDVPRDLRAARAAAGRRGLRIAFAADTHLHADFLSGVRQLAAEDGAQILAPAAGGRAFDHRGLADGDEVGLGGLMLRAWATPGPPDRSVRAAAPTSSDPPVNTPRVFGREDGELGYPGVRVTLSDCGSSGGASARDSPKRSNPLSFGVNGVPRRLE